MPLIDVDRETRRKLIRRRRRLGLDRYDEVWNGVYVMSPGPNPEHQIIIFGFATAFGQTLADQPGVLIFPGVNISERADDWAKNYWIPDVAVFLQNNPAIVKESYILGGPDFAVEIISRDDKSREKLDFYAEVATRELLIVDRYPWALELYRLIDGTLQLVGKSTLKQPTVVTSEVLPLTFALIPGDSRPMIEVTHTQDARRWLA